MVKTISLEWMKYIEGWASHMNELIILHHLNLVNWFSQGNYFTWNFMNIILVKKNLPQNNESY